MARTAPDPRVHGADRTGDVAPALVTAEVDGIERSLAVSIGGDGDPSSIVGRVIDELGTADLVVDRSGVGLRGAIAGRDLLTGDRLVHPGRRSLPALAGLQGPLRGAWATVDRELHLGRGGRFGPATIGDPEVSRDHLRIWPTPGALVAVDVGSTNGTSRNERPLVGTVPLRAGDRIELGASALVVLGDPPRADHLRPAGPRVHLLPGPPPAPPCGADAIEGPALGGDHPPDLAAVASAIAGWSPLLWNRPLTPGTGPRTRLGPAAPDLASLDLGRHRSVAVAGPPEVVAEHVAAWILHLAAAHPPTDLAVEVVDDRRPRSTATWLAEACSWLPHRPSSDADQSRPPPWTLTVVAHGGPIAIRPHPHGTTVWLGSAGAPPPEGCTASILLDETGGAVLDPSMGGAMQAFSPDRVGPATFASLARLLAPLCTQPPTASS